jgi:exonuclease SbcD
MTAYRFVHAADIHLDSPLRSLALRDPRLAEFIGNASRQVLARIVELCLEEQVNALLLAGDLYDGEQTSMKTARFLSEQLRRLDAAGIEVFIIRGNHDALSKITKELIFRRTCTCSVGVPKPSKSRGTAENDRS